MTAWQFTYNGYTWGNGKPISTQQVDGLDSLPDMDVSDAPRGQMDGMFPGYDVLRGRTIQQILRVINKNPVTREAELGLFRAAITKQSVDLPLTFQVDGQGLRRVYCRPRKRELTQDRRLVAFGLGEPRVEFFAADPRIYDDALQTASTGLAVLGTGLGFNATPNFSFGGASSSGDIIAVNAGDFPGPWTASITGPITDPYIQLVGTGQRIALTGTVAVGDTLLFDSLAKSIMLNGTASRYNLIKAGSEWFSLAPGSNQVTFGASSGSGTLTLNWRSTWI